MQRHATDVISLVFGVIFAGGALVWLLELTDYIERDDAWLFGPAVLITAGLVGLLVALRPRAGDEGPPDSNPVSERLP